MQYLEGMALPPITPETQPFWSGCQAGELRLQRCGKCAAVQFYPRILCTVCGATDDLQWVVASGRAQLASYSIVHLPVAPVYAQEVPYVVALVKLEEGPMMMTNLTNMDLTGIDPADVVPDMSLQVVFNKVTDEVTLPLFAPRGRT